MNFKDIKDLAALCIYLLAAIVLIYFVPVTLNRLVFLLFLPLFYKSKKNYLWIAFIFIIFEQPGKLFAGGLRTDEMRLPLYSIMPGISFSFGQLFILTGFVKAFNMKGKFTPTIFLRDNIRRLGLYFVFLLLITLLLNPSMEVFRYLYKVIILLSLYYSIFFLMRDEKEYVSFFKMLFPFCFVALSLQLNSLLAGSQLLTQFKEGAVSSGVLGDYEIQRPIELSFLLWLTFFGSLYFLINRLNYFRKYYLFAVNIVSYFAIAITATRSWVIAFTAGYLLILLLIPGTLSKVVFKNLLIILLIGIILFSINLFKDQYLSSLERIETLNSLIKGDLSAGGTASRYTKRAPAVWEAFKQSTIVFGEGFSPFYLKNQDGHVGFHNFLFNAGVVGILLLGFFIFELVRYPFKLNRMLSGKNPYKNSIIIFPIIFISMLLLNAGVQTIGYDVGPSRTIVIVVLLYFMNINMTNSRQFDENILKYSKTD